MGVTLHKFNKKNIFVLLNNVCQSKNDQYKKWRQVRVKCVQYAICGQNANCLNCPSQLFEETQLQFD